jgi:hypothetical protein
LESRGGEHSLLPPHRLAGEQWAAGKVRTFVESGTHDRGSGICPHKAIVTLDDIDVPLVKVEASRSSMSIFGAACPLII